MKNILVPTDFSTCAGYAAEAAMKLAQRAGAEIHFLHIMNTPVDWAALPKEMEEKYPETLQAVHLAEVALHRLEKQAEEYGLRVRTFLPFNKPNEAIIDHVNRMGHDFIVMGSHGAAGIRELMLGSNTQKVVRYSPVPVLVVKDDRGPFEVRNVVFASDFSDEADKPFSQVQDFAEVCGAHVHLLYVNVPGYFEETETSRDRIEAFRKRNGISCTRHIWNGFNEERGISGFAREIQADVISLATHGKVGVLRKLLPSVAGQLANHSGLPVLSVRVDARQ